MTESKAPHLIENLIWKEFPISMLESCNLENFYVSIHTLREKDFSQAETTEIVLELLSIYIHP